MVHHQDTAPIHGAMLENQVNFVLAIYPEDGHRIPSSRPLSTTPRASHAGGRRLIVGALSRRERATVIQHYHSNVTR
jgi:hypothetical protein